MAFLSQLQTSTVLGALQISASDCEELVLVESCNATPKECWPTSATQLLAEQHNMATPTTCCSGPDTRGPLSTMPVAAPLLQRCPPSREDILGSAQDYPQIASTWRLSWISQCLRQTTTDASALLQNEVLMRNVLEDVHIAWQQMTLCGAGGAPLPT